MTENERFEGTIRRFIFSSENFSVASFLSGPEIITVAGNLYGVPIKEKVTVFGTWVEHPKFGRQVKVSHWERRVPSTAEQAVAFLASGLIKGVGPVTARKIVQALGPNAVEIILEKGPGVLESIKGFKKKAKEAYQCIMETFEIQRVMAQLLPFGLTAKTAIKAHKKFGGRTVELIRENPYCLMDVDSIGFIKADEIARKFGIALDSLGRICGAIKYTLEEYTWNGGHCYMTMERLVDEALKLLNSKENCVKRSQLNTGISRMCETKEVTVEAGVVYLTAIYNMEAALAESIKSLTKKIVTRVTDSRIEGLIKRYEVLQGIRLEQEQKQAVAAILENNLLVLTGGPGVGKTTTVKAIIDVFSMVKPEAEIMLASPTGKASRRLSEVTGMEASTIHRLLGFKADSLLPEFNKDNRLRCDLLIVDEVSMLGIKLAKYLFDAIAPDTKVLLVGDVDQLPPVEPGNVLNDILRAGTPSVRLEKIFRQAAESQIVVGAHAINSGKMYTPDHIKDDFFFIEKEKPEDIQDTILRCVKRLQSLGNAMDDIQVLSPMKNGIVGTLELNKKLQEEINPSFGSSEIKRGMTSFRVGDKVICTKNNYDKDVFNGETGTVTRMTWEEDDITGLVVKYDDREISYARDELQDLELAYAITTHKSQGSEVRVVIMPVTTSHYVMLARNLVYTGITRAKDRVVLVGTKKAFGIAIRNDKQAKRNSRLAERIANVSFLEFDYPEASGQVKCILSS
ncbi:ATP-dependent RecD-like DNA helicase [Pelotomaculum propionicicum]|uniref:SF1B family DNA helicase RecD2 n=1 Tax=Pelotomaculum propionicicum TaxID=258475 RepID=UPI003B7CDA09